LLQYERIISVVKTCTGVVLARVITFTGDEEKTVGLLTMTTYGKRKAFNPRTDDWEVYQERLQFYMVANGIEDATKNSRVLRHGSMNVRTTESIRTF